MNTLPKASLSVRSPRKSRRLVQIIEASMLRRRKEAAPAAAIQVSDELGFMPCFVSNIQLHLCADFG